MSNRYGKVFLVGEKVLNIFTLVLLCLVIISQYLILYQPIPLKISLLEALEGKQLNNEFEHYVGDINVDRKTIILEIETSNISSLPKGKILVNDIQVNDFTDLRIPLQVRLNDKITLDFSDYQLELVVKITNIDKTSVPQEKIRIKQGEKYSFSIQ